MLFLLVTIHLAIAIALLNIAIATTDPRVLNRPLATIAAAVWPLSLPIVVVVAIATRSQNGSESAAQESFARTVS